MRPQDNHTTTPTGRGEAVEMNDKTRVYQNLWNNL